MLAEQAAESRRQEDKAKETLFEVQTQIAELTDAIDQR